MIASRWILLAVLIGLGAITFLVVAMVRAGAEPGNRCNPAGGCVDDISSPYAMRRAS